MNAKKTTENAPKPPGRKRHGAIETNTRARAHTRIYKTADAAAMSGSSIRGLIQALPQFRDVLARLSAHIWVSESGVG